MDRNAGFSQLLELIFANKATTSDEMVAHSSLPSSLLTEDFLKKLGDVVHFRKRLICYPFRKYFDKDILKIMCSHKDYVTSVITACFCDHEINRNIFDKFISVCAVVMFFNEETLSKTGVNFHDLNLPIVQVFYQNAEIRNPFLKSRDFKQFGKFIREHRFFNLNWDRNDLTSPDGASGFLEQNRRIMEELNSHRPLTDEMMAKLEDTVASMVQKILSNTALELPSLPSKSDLIKGLNKSRKKDKAKQTERKREAETALTIETSHWNSSLNSDSNPNCCTQQREDIAWHENIIQAVIRHNHSKNSHHENANNQKQVEAERTLEHLKNSINSLIEVLDEFNEE